MITILSFVAKKGIEYMRGEVYYNLSTKESIYSRTWSVCNTTEIKKFKSIVVPTANYQADLKYALEHGYKVTIEPTI